jgi:PAS domain S-box-containing protein
MTTGIKNNYNNEAFANSVLHSVSIAIGTEIAGKIEFANNSLCRLTGFKSSELKGKNLKLLFDESPEFDYVETLREVFSNRSTSIISTLKKKNGTVRKVLCHFSLLETEDNLPGIVFSVFDFSEGNKDLSLINQQVEHLSTIFNSMTNPFLIIRVKDYRVIKANRPSTSDSTIDDYKCYSLTHGFDSPCNGPDHPCPVKEVVETKQPVKVTHKHVNKNGSKVVVEIHAYPVLDENGDVKNIIEYSFENENAGTIIDISNGEKGLFKELYENATLGIYRSTPEGKIIIANPAALAILGYSSLNELLKVNLEQGYINSEDRDRFQKIMQAEGTTYGFETKWKRKDDTIIDLSISARAVKDGGDNIIYYEGVIEDITAKKLVEAEILRAKEEAEGMNRLKSNFLANISHELRTPLSGILGFAEILGEEIESPFQKEVIQNIYQSGLRLLRTLDSVMNFSKMEAQKIELARTDLNLANAVVNVIKWFKTEAANKKLLVETKIVEPHLTAKLDENLFKQILSNLIGNSIKYTAQGKIIVIVDKETKQNTSWAIVKVHDTGIGIHPQNQKYIFDAFRQESEGLSRKYEGMGLGLTITKKYVELMDGEISVESNPGSGSCFIVKFPRTNISSTNVGSEHIIKNSSNDDENGLPRVLLVENEEASVEITKYFLRGLCTIDSVDNGKDALLMLMENDYNAVIMDIDLAGPMDGIEATKEIRNISKFSNLPVIALTAYAMKGDKEKILASGCNYYMSKPFRRYEIYNLLSSVLANKK